MAKSGSLKISFTATLQKFGSLGEKSGWTYIAISEKVSQKLKPGNKKSFRIKGKLDSFEIKGVALIPMGDGSFILAVNATMRKGIKKQKGDEVAVCIEVDNDGPNLNKELMELLKDEPESEAYFKGLAPSHQLYFSKWVDSAKTEPTKEKRLAAILNALEKRWDYGQMIRAEKKVR